MQRSSPAQRRQHDLDDALKTIQRVNVLERRGDWSNAEFQLIMALLLDGAAPDEVTTILRERWLR